MLPQSCQGNLLCTNNVCTCENKTSLFWNKGKQKCTERIGYNKTCVTLPQSCKESLICTNKVCACENSAFWNEEKQICTEKVTFNKTCSDKESCIDGLDCKNEEGNLCRCKDEAKSFWNSKEKTCKERSIFGVECTVDTVNNCRDTLVCTAGVTGAECRCKEGDVWNSRTITCMTMSSIYGPCESDDHCIGDLVCKGTGNRYCKCGTDVEFWDIRTGNCQQRSSFSAVFVSTVQSFEVARKFCTRNHSGYLASDYEVQHLFPGCVMDDTNIWLEQSPQRTEQDKKYEDTHEQLCLFGIETGGKLYVNNQTNCSETYSFLCVSNKITSTSGTSNTNSSSCLPSVRNVPANTDILLTGTDPLLWPIYVGASVAIFLVIISITAVLCYKRRRKKKSNRGQGVFCDNRNVDLNYSEAVHENEYHLPNMNPAQRGQMANGEEGMYSLAQSDVSGARSGSTTQTTATDHYGYGVFGGKREENDDNGMYSHSGRMIDKGEYDTFEKRDRDRDVNDLYDHTRDVLMENQYDEIQKRK